MKKYLLVGVFLLTGLLYIKIGYFTNRADFYELIFSFSALFAVYFYLYKRKVNGKLLLVSALAFRLLLLFVVPNLSDDYFRFVWDGQLSASGINPFLHPPDYYIEQGITNISGINQQLYEQLNSPHYFTIYPPVAQLTFWAGAWFNPTDNLLWSVVIMRLFIIVSEVVSLIYIRKLIIHFNLPEKNWMLYAFNPMIIVELTGNLHHEAMMICFLILSIYFLVVKSHWIISALFFSLAVSSKLLPFMLLPLFFNHLGFCKSVKFYALIGTLVALTFVPFISLEMVENMSQSVNLYFKKFEFNASIYYVVRWIGFQVQGYNIIQTAGTRLSMVTLLFILFFTFNRKYEWKNLPTKMMFVFSIYLFLATIVHPWYISTILLFSIFTRFRYPILWSGMALLSYATYQTTTYTENLWLVGLEYGLVFGWLFWEIWNKYFNYKQALAYFD